MKSSLRGCRLDSDRGGGGRGRVIPHAKRFEVPTLATVALPVAVVEPAFGALPVTAARAPQALRASFGRAAWAAVDVAPVAASADGEHGLATRAPRQPQCRLRGFHGQRSVPTRNTAADAPRSPQTCDNPGWSSLCAFEDRGSSTRGLGARYSGSSSASADGRPDAALHALTGRRCAPRPDLRPGEGRAPLGSKTLGSGRKESVPGKARRLSERRNAQKTPVLRDRQHPDRLSALLLGCVLGP